MSSVGTELPYASEMTPDDSPLRLWSWGKLWIVCATLLLAWLCYLCVKFAKQALWILSEILVFWKVAFGSTKHSIDKNLRLHVYLCETKHLDEVSVNELYNFLLEVLSSESGTAQDLHKVLLSYSHIMICREKMDGSLRGLTLLGLERKEKYTLLKFGLTVFKNFYQGGPFLYLVPACMAIKELFLHPFTPLYVVGKAFTYKSYMMLFKFRELYPRHDRETPELFKNIIHDYAESVKRPSETYNPETFILERELSQARRFLAPISERELLNQHIKFFNEQNPGWRKGHCMCCVARCSWTDMLNAVLVVFKRAKPNKAEPASTTERGRKISARPPLKRGFTFQDPLAKGYAVAVYEMDAMAEVRDCSQPNPYVVRPPSLGAEESQTEFNIEVDI